MSKRPKPLKASPGPAKRRSPPRWQSTLARVWLWIAALGLIAFLIHGALQLNKNEWIFIGGMLGIVGAVFLTSWSLDVLGNRRDTGFTGGR